MCFINRPNRSCRIDACTPLCRWYLGRGSSLVASSTRWRRRSEGGWLWPESRKSPRPHNPVDRCRCIGRTAIPPEAERIALPEFLAGCTSQNATHTDSACGSTQPRASSTACTCSVSASDTVGIDSRVGRVHRSMSGACPDTRRNGGRLGAYQVVQTIYVNERYGVLCDLISGYFSRHAFVTGDDPEDDLRLSPLIRKWVDRKRERLTSSSAVVYASRLHYHEIGSGTLIVVRNNRSINCRNLIPDTAMRFFDGTPNSISFDAHTYWGSAVNGLAADVAQHLSRNGTRTIMLSLDDRITAIKSNPYLPWDLRLQELDAEIDGYLPHPTEFSHLRAALKLQLGAAWDALSENGRGFLLSGYVAYDHLDGASAVSLDASPAVLPLCKALEETIFRRLLLPFRRYVRDLNLDPRSLATADKRFNRLHAVTLDRSLRGLELGTLASQLEQLASAVPPLPPIGRLLIDFLATLAEPDFLQFQLYRDLFHLSRNFRNPAAHIDTVSFSGLQACLHLLIGTSRGDSGLLARVIAATDGVHRG